jgi:hypothetical protein
MAYYKLETKLSPNYTKASASRQGYGQDRTFKYGAGHWWGLWQSFYSHQGVVNGFMNPKRQVSANEVISDRLVTLMVLYPNIAWTTSKANPFTYSYEVDPQIMHKWRGGASSAQIALANRIFETVAQRMADTGHYQKEWFPHKKWASTQCNDIRWGELVARANKIVAERKKPAPKPTPAPKPKPDAEWVANAKPIKPIKLMVLTPQTQIVHLETLQNIKALGKGTWIDFARKTTVKGKTYLISSYSASNTLPNGILESTVGIPPEPPKEKPEWLKNWKDITDETMYTRVKADLVNLLNGNTIKTIPRGTKIEIASATEWHGQNYLITAYSTAKKSPHGIALVDLDKKPVKDTTTTEPVQPTPIVETTEPVGDEGAVKSTPVVDVVDSGTMDISQSKRSFQIMNKVITFLSGKKSYMISALIFTLGGLQALGVPIPVEVYTMLGGLLGVTLRQGISKVQ